MQRFSFIASVGDLGLFGGLAATRRRLAMSAAIATAAVVAYGLLIADFVLRRSSSVELNVVLISVQFLLVLGAAYIQAMWCGSVIFGDAWRRRTFLGERQQRDEVDVAIGDLKDYSLHFYGLLAACAAGSYLVITLAAGDYVDEYNVEGYYATLLRSDSADRRIEAIRGLVDPVREPSALRRPLRERVAAAVGDPSADVRPWAAWASGRLQIVEAAPALARLLADGTTPERIEAAVALGRLRDPAAERQMIGMLPGTLAEPDLAAAVAVGLGLMPSTDALPTLTGLLGAVPEDVEVAVLWAIGRARSTTPREAVLARWESADGSLRCAAAEALKHVTTVDDYDRMREAFGEGGADECDEQRWEERQYDPEHPLPPVVLVVGEELRLKYLKAAFNIGGPGLEEWLAGVAWDDTETVKMRVAADDLAEVLRTSPSRLPRR